MKEERCKGSAPTLGSLSWFLREAGVIVFAVIYFGTPFFLIYAALANLGEILRYK